MEGRFPAAAQCAALPTWRELIIPQDFICAQSVANLSFERTYEHFVLK